MTTHLFVYQAVGWREKTKGLIGVTNIYPLMIITRWGIHTFGLRHTIDIVIMHNNHVVEIKENLLPNRIFFWNPRYTNILELPSGTIKRKKITIGSSLLLTIRKKK